MRTATIPALAVSALLLAGPPALADRKPAPGNPAAGEPVADHERDEAIHRALRHLGKAVFKLPDASGTPRKPFTVALTGLDVLLAEGAKGLRTDGTRGRVDLARAYLEQYVEEVERRTADPAQLPARHGLADSRSIIQYTWPLGMASLFFGELHARGKHKGPARRAIARIARILLAAQQPGGGWGHGLVQEGGALPEGIPAGMGGYPNTLLASSNTVASGLALVHPLLPRKAAKSLTAARRYFVAAQLGNGNFPYDPSQRSAHLALTGVSRAAGSAFALHALGMPWDDPVMERTLAFVDEHFEYLSEGHGSSTLNLVHAALLQRARGEKPWKRFKAHYFRRLLAAQAEDGSMACICQGKAFGSTNDSRTLGAGLGAFGDGTKAYVTAAHTLILLLDRTAPRLLGGKKPSSTAPAPLTPR